MALFKIYHTMDENDLPDARKSGNSYIIADEEKKLARWLIDVTDTDRYGIVSEGILYKDEDDEAQVAKVDDLRAKAYLGELLNDGWSQEPNADGYYTQTVSTPGITCGLAGNIPPIISVADVKNQEEYNKLAYAEADADSGQVTFYTKKIPTTMDVIIVDYK